MLVLDTNHFSELERNSAAGQRLTKQLEVALADKAVTIITVEEQVRGWLAEINRTTNLTAKSPPTPNSNDRSKLLLIG